MVVCGRRPEPLEETAALAEGIETVACDIREEDQVDALVDGVLERHGRIDLLVNNAGGQYLAPAETITPKGFRTVMRLNVEGTWLMTHAVATKAMIPAGRRQGRSITLSPHNGLPGMAHSSAARAAVENLMTRAWRPSGRASASSSTRSPPGSSGRDTFMTKYPKPMVTDGRGTVPLRSGWGRAEEIAWMVAYLASPAGDFVSGSVITIDGGARQLGGPLAAADDGRRGGEPLAEARRPHPATKSLTVAGSSSWRKWPTPSTRCAACAGAAGRTAAVAAPWR